MKVYKITESEIFNSFYKNLNKKNFDTKIRKNAGILSAGMALATDLRRWPGLGRLLASDPAKITKFDDLMQALESNSINSYDEIIEGLKNIDPSFPDELVLHIKDTLKNPGASHFPDSMQLYATMAREGVTGYGWDPALKVAVDTLDPVAKFNFLNSNSSIMNGFLDVATKGDVESLIAGAGANTDEIDSILKGLRSSNQTLFTDYMNGAAANSEIAQAASRLLREDSSLASSLSDNTLKYLGENGLRQAVGITTPASASRAAMDAALGGDQAVRTMFDEGVRAVDEMTTEIAKLDDLTPILNKIKQGLPLQPDEVDKLRTFDPDGLETLAQTAERNMRNLDGALAGSPDAQRTLRLLDEYSYATSAARDAATRAGQLKRTLDTLGRLTPNAAIPSAMRTAAGEALQIRRLIHSPETSYLGKKLSQLSNLWHSANSQQLGARITNLTGSPTLGRFIQGSGPVVGRMASQLIFNRRMFGGSLVGGAAYSAVTSLYGMFYAVTGKTLVDQESVRGIKQSEEMALQQLNSISFNHTDRESLRTDLIASLQTSIASIDPGLAVLTKIEENTADNLVISSSDKTKMDKMFQDINNLEEKLILYNKRVFQLERADDLSKRDIRDQNMLAAYEQSKTVNTELLEKILTFFTDFAENLELLEGLVSPNMLSRLKEAITAGDPEAIQQTIQDIESGGGTPDDVESPDLSGRREEEEEDTRTRTTTRPTVSEEDEDKEEEDVDETDARRARSRSRITESLRGQVGTGGSRGQPGRRGAWTDGMYLFDTPFDISNMNPRFKANLIPMLKGVVSTPEGLAYIDPNFGSGRFGGNYMKAIENLYRSGAQTKREIIDLIKEEAGFYGGGTRRDVARAIHKYKERLKYYKQNQDFWSAQIQDDIQDYLADRAEIQSDEEVLRSEGSVNPKNEYIIKKSSYDILSSYLEEIKRL